MRREHAFLAMIFAAALATRLYFSFQSSYFGYDAYFSVRQIDSILATGLPSFNHLSYSPHIFLPLFHYLLAGSAILIPPPLAMKLVPNLFASLLVPVTYLLSLEITKNRTAALLSAFASGFMPVYFSSTINTISAYSLVVPLSMFLLYCFLKLDDKRFLAAFVVGMLVFVLAEPSALIFVLGLTFYLALAKAEHIRHSQTEIELVLFSTLLVLWIIFLIFKTPLLQHGPLAIWQNIPSALVSSRFVTFNVIAAIYEIGIIPFLAGGFVIYQYMLREKLKQVYVLMSFAVVVLLLLWLQLIERTVGLFFIGALFCVLFSQFYKVLNSYIINTKLAFSRRYLWVIFALALFATSLIPSITDARKNILDVPSDDVMNAFEWVRDNTGRDAVVLAPVKFGHLVTAVAKRRNVIDSGFLFAENIEERYSDVSSIYSSVSKTDAIRLLNKYDVAYILPEMVNGTLAPAYLEDDIQCFKKVYYPFPGVYRSLCDVQ